MESTQMVNEPTVDLESNQVSLASDTVLLLPTVLGASSDGQSPDGLRTGSVPEGFLPQDWKTLPSGRV